VDADELRHVVACVLAEDGKEPDQEIVKKFEEEGFKLHRLPRVENVVRTKFEYKSYVSIFIAVRRVYPLLTEYIQVSMTKCPTSCHLPPPSTPSLSLCIWNLILTFNISTCSDISF
jgi:hypothetical protein